VLAEACVRPSVESGEHFAGKATVAEAASRARRAPFVPRIAHARRIEGAHLGR
jgi:hypothetical protein